MGAFDLELLKRLVNEDEWDEYLEINLGHWVKQDLRKLSEDAKLKKDVDDRYYG